jgi:hypothetical protein
MDVFGLSDVGSQTAVRAMAVPPRGTNYTPLEIAKLKTIPSSRDPQPSAKTAVSLKDILDVHSGSKSRSTELCIRQRVDNTQQCAFSGCKTSLISRDPTWASNSGTASELSRGIQLKFMAIHIFV